ncbi:MAG: aminotransferase class IV [Gammaproteobacteria bacterium]
MYAFINQHITSMDSPLIQANDRGLLLGDGLFETLKAIKGLPLFFSKHFARLKRSAQFLAIPFLYSQNEMLSICQQVLNANKLDDKVASLRITLTRGCSNRGIDLPTDCQPTLLVTANSYSPINSYPKALVTSLQRNEHSPLIRHKTLNYLELILARKTAKEQGYDEGILLNSCGALTESATANIFLVLNNEEIITPRLEDGILPGITREVIFECCHIVNIPLSEQKIMPEQIKTATEAFQTNSLIGIQTFSFIDKHALCYGDTARITQRLISVYKTKEDEFINNFM